MAVTIETVETIPIRVVTGNIGPAEVVRDPQGQFVELRHRPKNSLAGVRREAVLFRFSNGGNGLL